MKHGLDTNQVEVGSSQRKWRRFLAFTLIELLVVYMVDDASRLAVRKVSEVRYPTRKAQMACFAASACSEAVVGHGTNGLSLMFVDGHSQFAQYSKLNPGTAGGYNLDWTEDGLEGADLR